MSKTDVAVSRRRKNMDLGPEDPVALLMEFQVLRRHLIRSQSRCDRATEALIACTMGYNTGLEENTRKALYRTAKAVRVGIEKAVENGTDPENIDPRIPGSFARMVMDSYRARKFFDLHREQIEKDMIKLARLLPVWPWVKTVKGVSELGLAVLIGEIGDLGAYSGPRKVWKRLGLACIDGVRQGSVPAEIKGDERKEAWKLRGYNPKRRAEVWAFFDDVMFRAQWRGAKKDAEGNITEPAHPIGPYGEVYRERKEWNNLRGSDYADRDARRFMVKRFILHLWVEWQKAISLPALEAAE